jgi:hypothetical protein
MVGRGRARRRIAVTPGAARHRRARRTRPAHPLQGRHWLTLDRLLLLCAPWATEAAMLSPGQISGRSTPTNTPALGAVPVPRPSPQRRPTGRRVSRPGTHPQHLGKGVPASAIAPEATTHPAATRPGHPARGRYAGRDPDAHTHHPNARCRQGEMQESPTACCCFAHHGQQKPLCCRLARFPATPLRRTPLRSETPCCLRRTSPLGDRHAPRTPQLGGTHQSEP